MPSPFPIRQFRLQSGYSFERPLDRREFRPNNFLVGRAEQGAELQGFFLGRLAEYGQMNTNVWVDLRGAHAIYVMGKRRSGKTFTLATIAESLASNQWIHQGPREQAILVLDTMNVLITMHHNVADVYGPESDEAKQQRQWGLDREDFPVVIYYPRGTTSPPEGVTRELSIRPADLSAEDWAAMFGVDTYSEPTGQLIAELHDKVTLEGYTDDTGNTVSPKLGYTVNDLLACLDTAHDVQRFPTQTIEAVRRRLRAIQRQSIFSETGVDIRALFRPGQIAVVLLRDLDHSLRGLLVGILVKKIKELRGVSDGYERLADIQQKKSIALESDDPEQAAKCQTKGEEYLQAARQGLPRGWILIDEAHNYIPSRGIVASRQPLRKYVKEGRNLGLSIVVATQQPSGLDPAIRRNADVLLIHSMSMRDDIEIARSMLTTFVPDSVTCGREKISSRVFEQLVRSLDLGYAIVSNDRISRIFPVKIRPRITVHGGKEY